MHRQRLFLNNQELLNSETLDQYGILCEQTADRQMLENIKSPSRPGLQNREHGKFERPHNIKDANQF